jgi:hypothetical protein
MMAFRHADCPMSRIFPLFFVALLSLFPATAGAEWTQYDPVLRIGSPTGWKNVMFVFWSHTSSESSWAQREILRSLTKEIENKDLTITMYQIAGSGEQEIRDASIFLCVPKENYGVIVIRYLDLLYAEKSGYSPSNFSRLIAKAGAGLGLPKKISNCWTGQAGFERATALNVHREALSRNWPFEKTPTFILNGRQIEVHDVKDIRERLLRQ